MQVQIVGARLLEVVCESLVASHLVVLQASKHVCCSYDVQLGLYGSSPQQHTGQAGY